MKYSELEIIMQMFIKKKLKNYNCPYAIFVSSLKRIHRNIIPKTTKIIGMEIKTVKIQAHF